MDNETTKDLLDKVIVLETSLLAVKAELRDLLELLREMNDAMEVSLEVTGEQ